MAELKNLRLESDSPLERKKEIDEELRMLGHSDKNLGEGTNDRVNQELHHLRRTSAHTEDKNLVGIEEKTAFLVSHLLKEDSSRCVISITGMRGVGKTTLARRVYNHIDVQKEFPYRAWVCDFEKYNFREIMKSIINQVDSTSDDSLEKLDDADLEEKHRRCLKGKRYLVVLDDIWQETGWDILSRVFPDEARGNRVLLTSWNKNVAQHADPLHSLYELETLGEEESWQLFSRNAFTDGRCPSSLEDLGWKIVRACGGLPLAITTIGSLLLQKKGLRREWESVYEDMSSHLRKGLNGVSTILELSYRDLPPDLKFCFKYLGIFPEDNEITVQKLTWLWVAEGIVVESDGARSLEDIAAGYLEQLISRNMVQAGKVSVEDKVKSCRLHDLLRDLANKKGKDENFLKTLSSGRGDDQPLVKSRKRDELMGELKNLSKELDSPLERANDHLNRLLRRAKKVWSNASKYLDQCQTTPYSAQDWGTLREEVGRFRRKHLDIRTTASSSSTPISITPVSKLLETEMFTSSTSISTTPDSKPSENERITSYPSWRVTRTEANSSQITKLCGIRRSLVKDKSIEWRSVIFWDLVCYPMDYKLFSQVKEKKLMQLVDELKPLLKSAIPKYSEDLEELASDSRPHKLVPLLSSSGGNLLVRKNGNLVELGADTFRRKHVLICCFHVPVLWGTRYFQALINLCEELYSTRDDFEMVMVARMNELADTPDVFDHFFSGFPESCLAVPYTQSNRRDHICKLLGLDSRLECIQCRFFDPNGTVLNFSPDRILDSYGAEAFPFTKKIMNGIDKDRKILWRSELKELLKPPPDVGVDAVVSQFNPNPASGSKEEVILSDVIKDKHVGLYMCSNGELIPQLHELHDKCREKPLDFEIVVLYCPMVEMLDPKLHKQKTDRLLQEHNVCSWWCSPFNNSVSWRFFDLTKHYDIGSSYHTYHYDKLIIVGPDSRIMDMYGAEVIRGFGVGGYSVGIDSHPFTREADVKNHIKRVQEITSESLFVEPVYRGDFDDWSKTTTVQELLKGKRKIIIYMDSLERMDYDACKYGSIPYDLVKLVSKYTEMKQAHEDEFEVVFFDNLEKAPPEEDEEEEGDEEEGAKPSVIHQMPWYVHPVNGTHSPSLLKLMDCLGREALFGFGVDGKLCSFRELGWKNAEICLEDTLHQDVKCLLSYSGYVDK